MTQQTLPDAQHATQRQVGLMIGDFEPLHLGHMRHILAAAGKVQDLHVVITPATMPHPDFAITLQDKARWLQMACADLPFVQVHTTTDTDLAEYGLSYEPPTAQDSDLQDDAPSAARAARYQRLCQTLHVTDTSVLVLTAAHPTVTAVQDAPALPILTIATQPEFDSLAIACDPIAHWPAIHPQARGDYTKTVAIVGGESSGKTTLVHKLANYYGASFALEMGRLYVGTDLGGSEVGLQYSDYAPIALDHAEAMRAATQAATAPVTIVDTDFVTTQAFCEEYEGRTHPFVSACIEEFRADFTIMLDNNTPWVADGMRSLGDAASRGRFEQRLIDIFARHDIAPYLIDKPDYDARYQQALSFIDQHIYGKTK